MRSAAAAKSRRPGARSVAPARRGGVEVSEVQRSRMLSSAVAIVSEYGYGQMSVARVTGRARVSRRTFYDVFEDRDDCFLAVFDDAVARVSELVVEVYESAGAGNNAPNSWREQVRAALTVLLVFLDEQPEVGSLLIVDALRAGPRVLERRVEVLRRLGAALDQGAPRAKTAKGHHLPPLTGEGVVGAVFSVIHTRLLVKRPEPLVELVNPLMSMIVLPYLGFATAQKELQVLVPEVARASRGRRGAKGSPALSLSSSDPLAELPMRLTYRTLRVLAAIGERPGASNRTVADLAEVVDQGQMSKLLARLERLGLVHNTGPGPQPHGEPNAWRLTALGEEVQRATQLASSSTTGQKPSRGVQRDEKKEKAA